MCIYSTRCHHQPPPLTIADLELDIKARRVTRAGQSIKLTAKEFSLLELFLRRQGEVLSRTLITEKIWNINFVNDSNVVEVTIRRLRVKIDEPFPERLIHTVRGFGYIMETRS
tara:strand:+ start:3507 stop:3845 length:339 start_codon:yes stop_codon:yes gene_type:complete